MTLSAACSMRSASAMRGSVRMPGPHAGGRWRVRVELQQHMETEKGAWACTLIVVES